MVIRFDKPLYATLSRASDIAQGSISMPTPDAIPIFTAVMMSTPEPVPISMALVFSSRHKLRHSVEDIPGLSGITGWWGAGPNQKMCHGKD